MTNLDICTIRRHEFLVDERASLSDVADGTVDATATSNLLYITATGKPL